MAAKVLAKGLLGLGMTLCVCVAAPAQDVDSDQRAISSGAFGAWAGKSVATVQLDERLPRIPETCLLQGDGVTLRIERYGQTQIQLGTTANGVNLFNANLITIDEASYRLRRTDTHVYSDAQSGVGAIQISSFRGFIALSVSQDGPWLPISGFAAYFANARSVVLVGHQDGKPYRADLALKGLKEGLSWCDMAFKYAL